LPHWQDCHELWSKKRRRQRQSGMAVEEPPVAKVSRKETTSVTSTDTVKNNSSPVPPQPAQLKAEPGAADAVGLGDITQQLNQSELAVLLNLLQSQTDLSVPQMAQLLNVHSNPEMQQQLEALNQSITALTEATAQHHEPPAAPAQEAIEEPPPEVPEEPQTPDAASAQGDMQNVLAVLLSQLMKSQEPGMPALEESNGDKSGEHRAPRKSPARHPEESSGKWRDKRCSCSHTQLLEQPEHPRDSDGAEELHPGQTLLEPSAQAPGKSRTFLGSVSHLGESSSYQGTGSLQFPGDQDLRFARGPVSIHSLGQSFGKSDGSNSTLAHPEAKIQNYGELGPGTAGSSGAGTAPGWGAPTQAPSSYGKTFRGPGRVPPRGGRGRGVPY
ncbi:CDK12 kinase, partial [Smithornis capensis]|nr:CDK12 kinase [Smithornis capensis]